ncbi:MAG: SGNH/GDSL hydrolase family protein [Pseudomonadota bacterium]
MTSRILAIAATLVLCCAAADARTFDRALIVGDSLSDQGRLDAVLGTLGLPTRTPAPPYVDGRFSNGPIWTDRLIGRLGLDPTRVDSLAVGGARTTGHNGTDGLDDAERAPLEALGLLGVKEQAAAFVASGGEISPKGLHVVWGGSNDYLFGNAFQPGAPDPVQTIVETVELLGAAGARSFLVLGVPDLGMIPQSVGDPVLGPLLSAASSQHNARLASALDATRDRLGLEVFALDVAALIAGAPAFGFANVTEPCIGLADCGGFLYFDGLHPTTAGHAVLADQALQVVPLPGTAVLFVSAAALLAWRSRRG